MMMTTRRKRRRTTSYLGVRQWEMTTTNKTRRRKVKGIDLER